MTENSNNLHETNGYLEQRQNVSVPALITGVVVATIVHNLIPKDIAVLKAGEAKTFLSGLLEGATRLRAWGAPAVGISTGLFVNSVARSKGDVKQRN